MLPVFRYHPDPVATGSVKLSDAICRCCGKARGYIYASSVYARESLRESICPWCIADGSAAATFEAMFVDDYPLLEAEVPEGIVSEVTRRTPGYNSWQQEAWLACCGDACEFHGDAERKELQSLQGIELAQVLEGWGWSKARWSKFITDYQPAGNPCVYKFVCRHCRGNRYAVDFT